MRWLTVTCPCVYQQEILQEYSWTTTSLVGCSLHSRMVFSPSSIQLAQMLLSLNLLLSALLAITRTKAAYKAVQLVSFSAGPWLPSLYLQYLQSPSDLSSRGEMLQALNFASQKIHSALYDRDLGGFLWKSIIVFIFGLAFVFFLPSKSSFFLTPRTACAASKGPSWLWHACSEQHGSCRERRKGRRMAVTEHMGLLPSISPCACHIRNESTAALQRVSSWVLLNLEAGTTV